LIQEVDTEQKIKITRPNLARFTKNGITFQCLKQKDALGVTGLELIEELKQMKRYLSTREVMKLIGVRRTTLCAWVRAGKISAILFLEFPDAALDHHPLDIDTQASGEFLLGPDLLIAPSPFPEELDEYMVEFPSADWYDYWTGEKVRGATAGSSAIPAQPVVPADQAPMVLLINRRLDTLPVFVRAGAILPISPLVQSTNEIPKGPLVLRVYAPLSGGTDYCGGTMYLDDGKTLAYHQGAYLRTHFTCQVRDGQFHLQIGPIRVRILHGGSKFAWRYLDGRRKSEQPDRTVLSQTRRSSSSETAWSRSRFPTTDTESICSSSRADSLTTPPSIVAMGLLTYESLHRLLICYSTSQLIRVLEQWNG
jgi:Glycosyl hydrolases family 31/Domain of unknown function (DUF5110)